MTQTNNLRVPLKMLRVGLGLALVLGTSAVAILCFNLALTQAGLRDRCLLAILAFFFGAQTCAAWKILLFPPPPQWVIRAVTGLLGFAGLAVVAFNTYRLFSSFSFAGLLFTVFGSAGAAIFLFCAFYLQDRWGLSRLGGASGTASARITCPRPIKPPVLAAAAAEPLPKPSESSEYHGAPAPNRPII